MNAGVPAVSQGGGAAGIDKLQLPALVVAAGARASTRFLEFFASTLRNPNTRRAYARAVTEFFAWCEEHGVPSIAAVQPLHVAAWIEGRTSARSAPTVKQELAAIRHLFDWLVIGQVVPLNSAASVRGPAHIVRKGKTPVLDPAEARALLDGIDVMRDVRPSRVLPPVDFCTGVRPTHAAKSRPERNVPPGLNSALFCGVGTSTGSDERFVLR